MIAQVYLDIETIPAQRPDVLEEIRAAEADSLSAALDAVRPPGNYKKQETIDEWMATEAPKIKQKLIDDSAAKVEDAYRKTGLDGSFGHIACVSFAYLDAEPVTIWLPDWEDPSCERDLLIALSDALDETIPANLHRVVQVVGHNVVGFDIRFLVQRAIITGVRPHHIIGAASQAKPWDLDRVYDTMIQWAGVGKTVSLDKLCKALGMPGKGDMDGSKVWDAIKAGRITEVAEYCADDVRKVRAVHQRMTFQTAPVVQEFEDVSA